MKQIAQIKLGPEGGFRGFGALGLEGGQSPTETFNKFLSTTIGVMSIVAFVWFTVQLFIGVVSIIGSGGDKNKLESAKTKIGSAVTGLVITVAAIFFIQLIGDVLGIPNILNPGAFVDSVVNGQ